MRRAEGVFWLVCGAAAVAWMSLMIYRMVFRDAATGLPIAVPVVVLVIFACGFEMLRVGWKQCASGKRELVFTWLGNKR